MAPPARSRAEQSGPSMAKDNPFLWPPPGCGPHRPPSTSPVLRFPTGAARAVILARPPGSTGARARAIPNPEAWDSSPPGNLLYHPRTPKRLFPIGTTVKSLQTLTYKGATTPWKRACGVRRSLTRSMVRVGKRGCRGEGGERHPPWSPLSQKILKPKSGRDGRRR